MQDRSASTDAGLTRLAVLAEHSGRRLDLFLAASTSVSRRRAKTLIAEGIVICNQRPVRIASRPVMAGDVVDILLPPSETGTESLTQSTAVDLLYEDRWILIANKPAGVLSQSAEGSDETPFDDRVLLHISLREGKRQFLRMIHRLDRLTSGAVVFARNPEALKPLSRAWSSGRAKRIYLAVVEGAPDFETMEVDAPIARDSGHHWRFRIDEKGREARTFVRMIDARDSDTAVMQCRLETGRTHQVRVHLAHLGLPVLGDRLYGSRRADEVNRPMLHASTVALPHPKTGKVFEVEAPLPEEFAPFVNEGPGG